MQNKLDFSGLERLTPRADSWDKICARLDAEATEVASTASKKRDRSNIIPFRILSAVPLAASLVLIGLSVLMTAFSNSSESVSINSVTSSEVASWYNSLGGENSSDGFETLDEHVTLSYFYKESK